MAVTTANFGIGGFNYPTTGSLLPGFNLQGFVYPVSGVIPSPFGPKLFPHSPAQIIQEMLLNLGYGVRSNDGIAADSTYTIYATALPDSPDGVIVVYDTQGLDFGRTTPDSERQQHYGVQILVRGSRYQETYAMCQRMGLSLDTVYSQSVQVISPTATYLVHAVTRTGTVLPLGTDSPKSKRRLFTINATASIKRIS